MKNTSIAQIAQILGVGHQTASLQVSGYQVDSRNVRPGDLFFALEGEREDGHQFLAQAGSKGAVAPMGWRQRANFGGGNHGGSCALAQPPAAAEKEYGRLLRTTHQSPPSHRRGAERQRGQPQLVQRPGHAV